jgi:hypothetical protein
MNKLIYVAVAAAAASGIAAAPAVAGLSNNTSFSHQLPVRVPSGAQTVSVDDEHSLAAHRGPSASPSAKDSRGPEAEPSDNRGQDAQDNDVNDVNDVNDDNGAVAEPGDDNGHDGAGVTSITLPSAGVTHEAEPEPEPGDDKGGAVKPVAASPAPQPVERGDDNGGAASGGSGSGGGGNH